MKILILHNRYRLSGGEDAVVEAEVKLLQSRGLDVIEHQVTNELTGIGLADRLQVVWESSWSEKSYEAVRNICRKYRPDIAHIHNFWFHLSPAIHAACQSENVKTVQTLHNFRLLCPSATFMREGQVCQDCLGKHPWRGVVRRCYNHSLVASAMVSRMIVVNRQRDTWNSDVDAFVALSEHSRRKFIEGGLDERKLWVKPNFLHDSYVDRAALSPSKSQTILFAGRFSEEKGLETLLKAWALLPEKRKARLQFIGDGPLRIELAEKAQKLGLGSADIEWCGQRSQDDLLSAMSKARAIVIPSICFENCPRTVIEAFCYGRPVIASSIGALDEFVTEGRNGLKAEPGNPIALSAVLGRALIDDGLMDQLGSGARQEYLNKFTPDTNFEMMTAIYEFALGKACRQMAAVVASV